MGALRSVYRKVAEPRVQRIGFLLIYLAHTTGGVGVLFDLFGPRPEELLGTVLTSLWAGFLLLGGLVGALAVLPGWNFVERGAIVSLCFGIAILVIVLLAAGYPPSGTFVALISIVGAWLFVFALRAWDIRTYLVAPKA